VRAAPDLSSFAWGIVPYPVRVAVWVALLGIVAFLCWLVNGALEDHYTARQNQLVAEDAARTNATKARIAESREKVTAARLSDREKRLAAAQNELKGKDDEMQRLKADSPEVRDWARTPVPEPVRARHRLR
jgi:cell division protein FtsX